MRRRRMRKMRCCMTLGFPHLWWPYDVFCFFFFLWRKHKPSDGFNRLLMYDKLKDLYEVDYLKILHYKLDSISMYHLYTFFYITYIHFLMCHQYSIVWHPLVQQLWFSLKFDKRFSDPLFLQYCDSPNLGDFLGLICFIGTIWLKDTLWVQSRWNWSECISESKISYKVFAFFMLLRFVSMMFTCLSKITKRINVNWESKYVPQTSIISYFRLCPWMFQMTWMYYITLLGTNSTSTWT